MRRRDCPTDVRGTFAVLTEEGRRALHDAAPGHVALVRELFIDALEPEQIALLADALETVGHRLRGDAPSPSAPLAR